MHHPIEIQPDAQPSVKKAKRKAKVRHFKGEMPNKFDIAVKEYRQAVAELRAHRKQTLVFKKKADAAAKRMNGLAKKLLVDG